MRRAMNLTSRDFSVALGFVHLKRASLPAHTEDDPPSSIAQWPRRVFSAKFLPNAGRRGHLLREHLARQEAGN